MKRIDLERAGDAEAFGALAVGRRHRRRRIGTPGSRLTPAQTHALSEMARSLVQTAKEAGAESKPFKPGGVFFELHRNGAEEILSIRKTVAS